MNEDAAHRLWVRDGGKRAHLPFASRASQRRTIGGLRDVEPARRAAEMELLDEHDEGVKVSQIHIRGGW
ncbi:hypothetical protein WME73_38850 [Sorangium sp. So ce302]|uniref:hypothetical protein n=1 Tax=Sorangium sp. So ce302 TaxID=3133297 RepID=UPI003F634727